MGGKQGKKTQLSHGGRKLQGSKRNRGCCSLQAEGRAGIWAPLPSSWEPPPWAHLLAQLNASPRCHRTRRAPAAPAPGGSRGESLPPGRPPLGSLFLSPGAGGGKGSLLEHLLVLKEFSKFQEHYVILTKKRLARPSIKAAGGHIKGSGAPPAPIFFFCSRGSPCTPPPQYSPQSPQQQHATADALHFYSHHTWFHSSPEITRKTCETKAASAAIPGRLSCSRFMDVRLPFSRRMKWRGALALSREGTNTLRFGDCRPLVHGTPRCPHCPSSPRRKGGLQLTEG